MRTVSESLAIQVPRDRLFTHLATRWETGHELEVGSERGAGSSAGRMGNGFRTPCPAVPWQLPQDTELVVCDFEPAEGWNARSADGSVRWDTRLRPLSPRTTRLTCRIHHSPDGVGARLRERLVARRRRARVLRRLIRSWRDAAEREEALRRLRAASSAQDRAPAPAEAPDRRNPHTT